MYTDYGYSEAGVGALLASLGIVWIIALVLCIVLYVALWKVYAKAGEPGWAAIVPFYSNYVLFKIAFGNGWFFLLCLIPYVGIIALYAAYFMLAKKFGKGVGFGIGMILLTVIFLPILAFGSAEYEG